MVDDKKVPELKKHVATIHSSNKLTLLQRKIANAILYNAYDELVEKDEHVIHIRTLCKLIEYDSNDHRLIKKSLINLLSTVVEWNLVDGDKLDHDGVWNASSIIADASIEGSICTYSYSNKMKKLLHRPELYGRLNMLVQAKFQSSYGLALYENCIRYQNIEQTPWFDFMQFRKLMGVEDGKYKIFRDFKHRVLDKAIEEVNKYSPIQIEPNIRKQNRKIIAIQFQIKQAKTAISTANIELTNQQPLFELLKHKFGLSKKQIQFILIQYQEAYIRDKIFLIESSTSFKIGKIKNLAKYLMSALSDDYQPIKSSATLSKSQNDQYGIKFDDRRKEQDLAEKKKQQLNQKMLAQFHLKLPEEKNHILEGFETHLRGVYLDIYRREGLQNFHIMNQFCLFIQLNNVVLLDRK